MDPDRTLDRLAELAHYWICEPERTAERAWRVLEEVEQLAAGLSPARSARWRQLFADLLRVLPPDGPGAGTAEAA